MYAIRLHEFGPPENLRYEQVDDPEPGPGEVRIAVAAAGVHFIDTRIRAGQPGPMPPPTLPQIPGREVGGVVGAVGEGTDASWLGRRVVAHLGAASGGYAELAVVSAEELLPVPDGLSDETAVAMLGTGRTTIAILDAAQLTADDVVLVTAAAGGIGSLLVQAGHNVGATVVGLAGGPAKLDRVRGLGADLAVDYTEPGWDQRVRDGLGGREPTVALDGVGGEAGRTTLELLGVGGRILFFGNASGELTRLSTGDLFSRGLTASAAIGARLARVPGGLRRVAERALAEAAGGRLVPLVDKPYPLSEAAAAHAALERRATMGKVVLVP
jgi:NADPH2:quinone reductase